MRIWMRRWASVIRRRDICQGRIMRLLWVTWPCRRWGFHARSGRRCCWRSGSMTRRLSRHLPYAAIITGTAWLWHRLPRCRRALATGLRRLRQSLRWREILTRLTIRAGLWRTLIFRWDLVLKGRQSGSGNDAVFRKMRPWGSTGLTWESR